MLAAVGSSCSDQHQDQHQERGNVKVVLSHPETLLPLAELSSSRASYICEHQRSAAQQTWVEEKIGGSYRLDARSRGSYKLNVAVLWGTTGRGLVSGLGVSSTFSTSQSSSAGSYWPEALWGGALDTSLDCFCVGLEHRHLCPLPFPA